ncbi:MAG: Ku protein [Janthinobacterium lividum]
MILKVRRTDGSRVRYKRVAEADGEEAAYADIAKGYELSDGSMVVITEDDLAELPLPTKRTVDVREFVPLSEVDPIYFNESYYLEPDKGG